MVAIEYQDIYLYEIRLITSRILKKVHRLSKRSGVLSL